MHRSTRLIAALAAVLGLPACTGSTSGEVAITTLSPTSQPESTTTSSPPIILGVGQILALTAGQCWGELPSPPPVTSVPESPTVAIVDCGGSSLGLAYGQGCLGSQPADSPDPVIEVPCPGVAGDRWTSEREIQNALAEICLPQFEAGTGERFATSDLDAIEYFPDDELWRLGERRYVCTAQLPPTDPNGQNE